MNYNQVKIGDVFSFETKLTQKNVQQFAELTGDLNPLHLDSVYASKTVFKKNVVHGMLAGSLFSRLIGMMCPGKRSLYLSQNLEFRKPIFPDSVLTVKGTIIQKTDSAQMVTLLTEIFTGKEIAIKGEARAQFLRGENDV